jgi:transcription initiation factor TFIIIB Brf1 subunit/transcription initiation factor TFIIB
LDNSFLNNDQNKSTKDNPSKEADWDEVATPRDSSEQSLVDMIGKTQTCIQELGGTESDCVRGAEILTDIWQRGYFQGRSTNVGIAAAVYVTFRSQNPRPLSIVATVCDISTEKLRSGYRSLRSEYGISGNIVDSAAYLSFLSSKLSLSQPVLEQAKLLIESSSSIAGNPTGIAAAALYLAAQSTDETITL